VPVDQGENTSPIETATTSISTFFWGGKRDSKMDVKSKREEKGELCLTKRALPFLKETRPRWGNEFGLREGGEN